jgi:hypothetical protein
MIKTTWTKKGLTLEITDTCGDCLVQGGCIGQRHWWSHESLAKLDIFGEGNLMDIINEHHTTKLEQLIHTMHPDRVLSHGRIIE